MFARQNAIFHAPGAKTVTSPGNCKFVELGLSRK